LRQVSSSAGRSGREGSEEEARVTEDRVNDALEKLNRGIQESKQMVQQQTMRLAQDFFGDSAEEIKQQIKDSRATLEELPDQIPGGQEESFQMLFQELMDNYSAVEQALDEAQQNVANLDTESLVKQGEIEATDAARREARERGVDLTQIEGTGSGGRITVVDVVEFAEDQAGEEGAEQEPKASEAARRRAEEMGLDLSQIEGTGSGGLITVKDVTSLTEETQQQATDTAQRAVGRATEQVDGAVGQATEAAGQATSGDGSGEPRATNAARRKAEELGIDLSQIEGSGAGGLITIRDVVES
jgi:pyruvate/2-oxoglutarate dehydrogenase complex dihydrolipoamide acyltransferase (E2) component